VDEWLARVSREGLAQVPVFCIPVEDVVAHVRRQPFADRSTHSNG
jgi:hypothetical protein